MGPMAWARRAKHTGFSCLWDSLLVPAVSQVSLYSVAFSLENKAKQGQAQTGGFLGRSCASWRLFLAVPECAVARHADAEACRRRCRRVSLPGMRHALQDQVLFPTIAVVTAALDAMMYSVCKERSCVQGPSASWQAVGSGLYQPCCPVCASPPCACASRATPAAPAAPGAPGLLGAGNPLAPGILGGLPGVPAVPGALPGTVISQMENIGTPSEYLLLKNMFTSGEEVRPRPLQPWGD